jgi:hypothetical protein
MSPSCFRSTNMAGQRHLPQGDINPRSERATLCPHMGTCARVGGDLLSRPRLPFSHVPNFTTVYHFRGECLCPDQKTGQKPTRHPPSPGFRQIFGFRLNRSADATILPTSSFPHHRAFLLHPQNIHTSSLPPNCSPVSLPSAPWRQRPSRGRLQ